MASFDMYRWFSDVMNRVHGFLGYLERIHIQDWVEIEGQKMPTFQVIHHIGHQALYYTCRCMRRVHQFPKLLLSSPVGRNCRVRGRKALSGKSVCSTSGHDNSCIINLGERTIDANMQP